MVRAVTPAAGQIFGRAPAGRGDHLHGSLTSLPLRRATGNVSKKPLAIGGPAGNASDGLERWRTRGAAGHRSGRLAGATSVWTALLAVYTVRLGGKAVTRAVSRPRSKARDEDKSCNSWRYRNRRPAGARRA